MHDIDKRLGELLFQVLYLLPLSRLCFQQVNGLHAQQAVDIDDDLLGCRRREPPRSGVVAAGSAVIRQMTVGDGIRGKGACVVRVRFVAVLVRVNPLRGECSPQPLPNLRMSAAARRRI